MLNKKNKLNKLFSLFLVLCFSIISIISFSGCSEINANMYMSMVLHRPDSYINGDTDILELYADNVLTISNNICNDLLNNFGVHNNENQMTDFRSLFMINNNNTNFSVINTSRDFSIINSYIYYRLPTLNVPILALGNVYLTSGTIDGATEIKDNKIYSTLSSSSSTKLMQLSNTIDSNKLLLSGAELQTNNVYKLYNSTSMEIDQVVYFFIGNNIGGYDISTNEGALQLINKIYSGNYAKIQHDVNLNEVINTTTASPISYNKWNFSLNTSDFTSYYANPEEYKKIFIQKYSEDIAVQLYKSLLVGNEVQRFGTLYTSALTGYNTVFTLQDFYLEAIKYIGVDRSKSTFSIIKLGKTFASTQFGEKKVFLMACRQFRLQYGYSEYSVENLFSYAFVEEIIGGQADNIKDSILQILVSNANYSYSEDEESQNVSYSLMKNYLDGDSQQQTNLTLPFVSNVYDLSDVSLFPTDNSYFINSMIFKGVTNQDSIEISSFYMSFSCDNIDSIINNYTFLVKYCTYGLFGMSSVEMFLLDMNEDTISNLEVGLLYFEFQDLIRLNNNGDVNSIQDRDPIILNTATKDGSIPTFNNNVLNYADEFNVSKTWGTYGNGCLYNSKKEKNDYFEIIMLSSLYVPISIEMIYF